MDPLTVFNPAAGTRGQAFILPNNVPSPLEILKDRQRQQRAEQRQQQQIQQQKESEAAQWLESWRPDPAATWQQDYGEAAKLYKEIQDYTTDLVAQGIFPTDAARHPNEYRVLQGMVSKIETYANKVQNQKNAYEQYLKSLSSDKSGTYKLADALERAETFRNLPANERQGMDLSLRGMFNLSGIADNALKSYKPDSDQLLEFDGKGGRVSKTIATYSDTQRESMRNALILDPNFADAVEYEFDQLDEEEQDAAGGIQGMLQRRADEYVKLRESTQIKRLHGSDAAYFSRQRIELQKQNLQLQKQKAAQAANKTTKTATGQTVAAKEAEQYQERASQVQRVFTEDEAAKLITGTSTADGGTVTGVKRLVQDGGNLSKFVINGGSSSGVIELTIKDKNGRTKPLRLENTRENQALISDLINSKSGSRKLDSYKLLDYLQPATPPEETPAKPANSGFPAFPVEMPTPVKTPGFGN